MSRPSAPVGMNETITRMRESGVVAVLRGVDADVVDAVGDALHAGGVTAMEVTMGSDDSLEAIEALAEHFRDEEVVVGAGTVLDAATARQARASSPRIP